jgi:hypothetical protein
MEVITTNTEEITKVLYEAAQRQKVCSLVITNEPSERIIHPYGVCQTGKNKIMIICWQESGFAGTSKLPGYRNLALMKCTTAELLDRHFLVRGDFNPADTSYMDWVFHVGR